MLKICSFLIFLSLFISINLLGQQRISTLPPGAGEIGQKSHNNTADQNAITQVKSFYSYLLDLPNHSTNKVLSGQNVRRADTYYQDMGRIYDSTGEYPAIIGVDYCASNWGNVTDANNAVIPFVKGGGACIMSWLLDNPYRGGPFNQTPNVNFDSLVTAGKWLNSWYNKVLDSLAAGLLVLQRNNIPVMLKFMHEMNGHWLWWDDKDPARYITAWRYAFNYLTQTKGVHNVLWIYCIYEGSASEGTVMDFYPGDNYVDLVSLDYYDKGSIDRAGGGYRELAATGKPFGLGELGLCGTQSGDPDCYILKDESGVISGIRKYMPLTTFFLQWHQEWGMANNYNIQGLFNDPWIVIKGEVRY
jgi:mannan endo-1,4-beta-mannosidase